MKGTFTSFSVLYLYIVFLHGSPKPAEAVDDYDVRLVQSGNVSGYLEIHWNRSWYGVLPHLFDRNAAKIACRDLGFDYLCRRESTTGPYQQEVETFNQSPLCTGKEESLSSCKWAMTSQNDVLQGTTPRLVLKCVNAGDDVLRLDGGVIPSEGTLQIRCDSHEDWRVLCGGQQWDARDCNVICLQMGYKMCTRWESSQSTIWNISDVISSDLLCGFKESHFLECDVSLRQTCNIDNDGVAWMSCGIEANIQGTTGDILCGSEHTCANQCGLWQSEGRCNCDTACTTFNDCCFDYDQRCNTEGNPTVDEHSYLQFYQDFGLRNFLKCIHVAKYVNRTAYIVVAACPPGYNEPGTIKQCEEDPLDQDMFARTPVYDNIGITFKNVYCAICHGRKVENISPWTIGKPYSLGTELVEDDIFDIRLPVGNKYDPIVDLQSSNLNLRACQQNLNFSCSESLKSTTDAEIFSNFQKRCRLYYAPIKKLVAYQGLITFRNPDCYICADLPLNRPPESAGYCYHFTDYLCDESGNLPCRFHKKILNIFPQDLISVLFHFSKLNQYAQRKNKTCRGEGMTYDPFLDVCRLLECPNYYCNIGSKCVPCSVPVNTSITARIVGNTSTEGIVEILHGRKWYTALRALFDEKASKVLCRENDLEYEPTSFMVERKDSVNSSWYTIEIQCNGSEIALSDCNTTFPSDLFEENKTTAAVITCTNKTETRIRLNGGILPSEGFVQVQFSPSEPWHFISGNTDHWDLRECKAVCRELNFTKGCASSSRLPLSPSVSIETVFAVTRDFYCFHDSDRIYSCSSRPYWLELVESFAWVTCAIDTKIEGATLTICGSSQTCRNRCGFWHGSCNCDRRCHEFGDCCSDYQELCGQVSELHVSFIPFPTKYDLHRYNCSIPLVLHFNIIMIDSCLEDWVPDLISSLCTAEAGFDQFTRTAVFDEQGVVYRNRFCALCNGVPTSNIREYSPDFIARVSDPNFVRYSESILGFPRKCFQGAADQCFDRRSNPDVSMAYGSRMCPTLHLPIEAMHTNVRNPHLFRFKNIFCQECYFDTPINDPVTYCSLDRCPEEEKGGHKECLFFTPALLKGQLSTILERKSSQSSITPVCSGVGEAYDPSTFQCYFIGCPEGFFYRASGCFEGPPPYNAPHSVLTKITGDCYNCMTSLTVDVARHIFDMEVCSLMSNASISGSGPFSVNIVTNSIFAWLSVHDTLDRILLQTAAKSLVFHGCGAAVIYVSLQSDDLIKEGCDHMTNIPHLHSGFCHLNSNIFTVYEYTTESEIFQRDNNLTIPCWNSLIKLLDCRLSPGQSSSHFNFDHQAENEVIMPGHVIQRLDEFTWQLRMNNKSLVCSFKVNNIISISHAIIGDCCLSLAIISISVTMVTYRKFKILSSVPHHRRMNLLFSLFIVCVAQIFLEKVTSNYVLCWVNAAVLHYAWLAHILWLSVIFYQTFYKFKYQLSKSPFNFRESGNNLRCGFFAWGLPLVVVLLCSYLSICKCIPGVVIHYHSNGNICLIGDEVASVVTVCLPTFVVISFGMGSQIYSVKRLAHLKSSISHHQQATGAYATLSSEIRDNILHLVFLFVTAGLGMALFLWPSVAGLGLTFEIVAALNWIILSLWFLYKERALSLWLKFLFPNRFKEQ